MPYISPSHRILFAILLLGVWAQVSQALLIREGLVVFYGNEVSLGAFFASWLGWFALGSGLMLWRRARPWVGAARLRLAALLLALPPLALVQVLALRGARWVLETPAAELVPLGDLFGALALVTLPGALALGLAFPLSAKALADSLEPGSRVPGLVARLYVLESLGAFLGGLLFTFVLLPWSGIWRGLGGLTLALALAAGLLAEGRRWRWGAGLLGLAGLVLAVTPLGDRLGQGLEALRFAALQPGMELLAAVETPYGQVVVAHLGAQVSVVVDGRIADSFPQPQQAEQEAAYVLAQAAGPRRVLMFGGLGGELAAELLRYPIARLDLVEPDRGAFETLRPHLPAAQRQALEDSRLGIHFLDGRRFLRERPPGEPYDLVLAPRAAPTTAQGNRYFTQEFYQQVRDLLAPGGVFCTQVAGAANYLGRAVRGYTASVFATLQSVLPEVAIRPGETQVLCAAATADRVSEFPGELERRYLAIPLEERRFPALGFYSLLPQGHIRYTRSQWEAEPGDLNRDAQPVTYYLNMLLWGQYTASGLVEGLERLRRLGPWPYLIPAGVWVLLWLGRLSVHGFARPRVRRQAAGLALGVLGLVAMAVQLGLLFSYQAQVGFMFERLALLNGLFMTGLALGTGLLGRHLAPGPGADRWLMGLLGLVALGLWGLPAGLEWLAGSGVGGQEAAYLALAALTGLLAGAGYALALPSAQADLGTASATSGWVQFADNLGGALGGLLTGALLIPLLGLGGTCRLLAVLCLGALLPLVYARFAPTPGPRLRARGGRAFPWVWPGWVLAFGVLTLFGWTLAERGSTPGPQVRFEEQALLELSGAARIQAREQPFAHYLGWDPGRAGPDPDNLSLSSMTVAAEVQGYAGPLNLLVALGRDGRLRGVRYIASHETPSYIEGLQDWLTALAGQDLSREGLALGRLDALAGATVTSRAALETINRTARAGGAAGFQQTWAPDPAAPDQPLGAPRFWVSLVLLLVAVPVYLSGRERARLLVQGAALLILGVWLNSLVTEADLVNLSLGRWPSWADNPQRWLLTGFVLVTSVLFGQLWCGYLCPFGALQEFVSRLGRWLGWRAYPQRPLETRARFLKFLLLAGVLAAVWVTGDPQWASFNPMQHAFARRWEPWMGWLTALVLVAALVHVRFWCRYFCPMGAFLALWNKLALLQHRGPRRRYERCDLGVREDFDLDCIRCHRCLSGQDIGTRRGVGRGPGDSASGKVISGETQLYKLEAILMPGSRHSLPRRLAPKPSFRQGLPEPSNQGNAIRLPLTY